LQSPVRCLIAQAGALPGNAPGYSFTFLELRGGKIHFLTFLALV
jgi:hypothetical protein